MLKSTVPLTIIDVCPITGPAAYGRKKFVDVLNSLGCQIAIVRDIDHARSQKRISSLISS